MPIVACEKCGAKNRVEEQMAEKRQPTCGRCGNELHLESASQVDTSKPLLVTDATFNHQVLGAGARPVLLDCWAPWCGPCRMVGPILDQLASESNGKYMIAKLNVDENRRVAAQFNIRSIPTMLIFKHGALVNTLVGAQPKQAIAQALENAARA